MMRTILGIHLFLSILFSVLLYLKEKYLNYAITALLISLALPGLGMVLFLAIGFDFFNSNVKQDDHIIKEHSGRKYFKELNIADETNVVSIEESLLISDTNQRRETIMKALKEDALKYIHFISTAINNDDAETAHYAAASMLHTRRVLDIKMRETSKIRHENPDNITIAMDYFDITDRYIKIFDLDADMMAKYIEDNILILKKIIEDKVQTPPKYIIKLIELLIVTNNYTEAQKYCKILLSSYTDNEEKYMGLLKSYYEMKNKKNFDLILRRFIDSDVTFSNEVLEIIRFWITVPVER
ncbi:MAG: hypothetical protein WBH44_02700 [Proteocatella sp.]